MRFHELLSRHDAQTMRAVTAKVTAVSGRTVTVDHAGASLSGVPCLSLYAAPAVNDVALLLKIGPGAGPGWVAATAVG